MINHMGNYMADHVCVVSIPKPHTPAMIAEALLDNFEQAQNSGRNVARLERTDEGRDKSGGVKRWATRSYARSAEWKASLSVAHQATRLVASSIIRGNGQTTSVI